MYYHFLDVKMCGIYFCFGDSTGEEFKEFETKCMCMLKRYFFVIFAPISKLNLNDLDF